MHRKCMYLRVMRMYVCMYVCMYNTYTCMYVYMYVCMYDSRIWHFLCDRLFTEISRVELVSRTLLDKTGNRYERFTRIHAPPFLLFIMFIQWIWNWNLYTELFTIHLTSYVPWTIKTVIISSILSNIFVRFDRLVRPRDTFASGTFGRLII